MNCIIASSSTVHGATYLAYLRDELASLFEGVSELIFIPYARPNGISHDEYTQHAASFFETLGIHVKGIHTFASPIEALKNAQGIFTGGGNTFLLVKQLHQLGLMPVLKTTILNSVPYLGTSAGSNICGLTMQTTNDMPIVMPPSFETLGVLPFNINAHYLDPDPSSTHKGETRETRIFEFHTQQSAPVVGLREGSWIEAINHRFYLRGKLTARMFIQHKKPFEIQSNTEILIEEM